MSVTQAYGLTFSVDGVVFRSTVALDGGRDCESSDSETLRNASGVSVLWSLKENTDHSASSCYLTPCSHKRMHPKTEVPGNQSSQIPYIAYGRDHSLNSPERRLLRGSKSRPFNPKLSLNA